MIITPTSLVRAGWLQEDLSAIVDRWGLPFEKCRETLSDEQYELFENTEDPRLIVLTKSNCGRRNFDGYNTIFACMTYSEKRAEDSYREFCRIAKTEFRPPLKDIDEESRNFLLYFVERVEKTCKK